MYRRRELRVRGRETEDSATKRNYNIHERGGQTKRQWAVGGQTDRHTDRDRDSERQLWPSEFLLSVITKSEHMYG